MSDPLNGPEKIRLAPPPTFWNSWPARIGSILFVYLFLSGLYTYTTSSWTPYYQLTMLAHLILGVPFILLFFYYIIEHLKKTLGTSRPVWIFLILGVVVAILTPTGPYISRLLKIPRLDILAFFLMPVILLVYIFQLNKRLPLPKDRVALAFGFLTLFFVAILSVSGPMFMLGLFCYPGGYPYIYAHQWTGLGIAGTLLLHVIYQFRMLRRQKVRRERGTGKSLMDNRLVVIGGGALSIALAVGVAAALYEPPDIVNATPEGYSSKYGSLFKPAEIKTSTDTLLDYRLISDSAGCGSVGCHIEIFQQWQVSSHGLAGLDHVAALEEMYAGKFGVEGARFCAGCHAPVSLLAGEFDETSWRPGMLVGSALHKEGVSCMVCHSMTEAEEKGNASFTVAPRKFYMYQFSENPRLKQMNNVLIKLKPTLHKRQFNADLYKLPRACAPCHVQFLPEAFSDRNDIHTQDHFGQWKESPYYVSEEDLAAAAGHSFKPEAYGKEDSSQVSLKGRVDPYFEENADQKGLTCQNCHMAFLRRNNFDDYYADHRFLGGNNVAPVLAETFAGVKMPQRGERYGGANGGNIFLRDLEEETEKWLRGEIDIPRIHRRWREGPVLTMSLDMPASASPGETVKLKVVTTNNKAGHNFPSGPMDLLEPWLELTITDAAGKTVFHSGGLDENNYLEPDAHVLHHRELDANGGQIERHELWKIVRMGEDRTIPAGGSIADEWEVLVPEDAVGELRVEAKWNYRKAQQHIVDAIIDNFGLFPEGFTYPAVVMNSAEHVIKINGR